MTETSINKRGGESDASKIIGQCHSQCDSTGQRGLRLKLSWQILRFGVGFYSTFVVADKVEVRLLASDVFLVPNKRDAGLHQNGRQREG